MGSMRTTGFRIDHDIAVAMIGSDNHRASDSLQCFNRTSKALIDGFAGGNRCVQIARVSYHIRVGIVHDDQVVPILDGLHKSIGDFTSRHLGLQIVGGDIRRLWHLPVFALKRHLFTAVQKECHMRVLFGFGKAVLSQAFLCNPVAKCVHDLRLRIHRGHIF